ncbi:MAG: hypothetical protein KC910_31565 [Candidatus Eremiobacteraeota bacterium]|nr:hypothetical protein [Candidatus Eremiobacteraeota bacterium]
MLTDTQISGLRAAFPAEALSADNSRGFELTSIKAAFIIERLNEVFGPCGCGWRYVHSPFEMIEGEVVTEVALQFRVVDGGCDPVVWDAQARNWAFAPDSGAWAWPIYSPGGRRPGKGNAPITDARKGAVTDGLTKAASMIGVGQDVFKGLVRTGQAPQKASERAHPARTTQQPATNRKAPQGGSTPSQKPASSTVPSSEPEKPATQASSQLSPSRAINGNNADAGKINGAAATNGVAHPGKTNGADKTNGTQQAGKVNGAATPNDATTNGATQAGEANGDAKTNGASQAGSTNGATQTGKTNGAGNTNGASQATNSNGASHGTKTNGAKQASQGNNQRRASTPYNSTTFWQLANQYSHKLDRSVVSALAKHVVMGSMSWIEAQSQLDDLIDAASLPRFRSMSSVAEGGDNGPVDPLDELFS